MKCDIHFLSPFVFFIPSLSFYLFSFFCSTFFLCLSVFSHYFTLHSFFFLSFVEFYFAFFGTFRRSKLRRAYQALNRRQKGKKERVRENEREKEKEKRETHTLLKTRFSVEKQQRATSADAADICQVTFIVYLKTQIFNNKSVGTV